MQNSFSNLVGRNFADTSYKPGIHITLPDARIVGEEHHVAAKEHADARGADFSGSFDRLAASF